MSLAAPAERDSRWALSVRFAIEAASQAEARVVIGQTLASLDRELSLHGEPVYRPFQASARYLGGHSRTRREAGGARRPGEPLPLCRSSLRCGGDLDVLPLRHYADQEVALAARHSVREARRQRRRGAPGVAGCEDLVRGEVGSDLLRRRIAGELRRLIPARDRKPGGHGGPWLGWRGAAAPDVSRRPGQALAPSAACDPL